IHRIRKLDNRPVIDFSANINPLGLPEKIKRVLQRNFAAILHYPDPDATELTLKIAQCWKIDRKNILVGNGSVDLLYLIISTFRPKRVGIPQPTFSEYERAARSIKSKIKFSQLKKKDGFKLNESCLDQTDIGFVCNPNNPTGNLLLPNGKGIEKMPERFLVVDEAFMDFLPDGRDHTLIWKGEKDKKIIILRSFTKIFALPGLRGGYLIAHQDTIETLKECQPPWAMNSLSQQICTIMLNDRGYLKETRKLIEGEREFLLERIGNIKGLTAYPSRTNFLLLRIDRENINSSTLVERGIRKGVLIRDCGNFRGLSDRYIRIAVRSHKENLRLIKVLKELL
ncbi:MAG: aminotransferase class I/II-fold pyridoxal phosphate-dependent enzyme, partial [Deltaproteobacteria bacterium]|nr:aminotransferase class I/II-fold pyridoxal phosphate-dependent enzyme [Deltaproteobacteria bacterium]